MAVRKKLSVKMYCYYIYFGDFVLVFFDSMMMEIKIMMIMILCETIIKIHITTKNVYSFVLLLCW